MGTKKAVVAIAKKSSATSMKRVAKPASVKAAIKPAAKMATKQVVKMKAASNSSEKLIKNYPTGWRQNPDGKILVEEKIARSKPVSVSKLRRGLTAAQDDIKQSLQEIAAIMTMDFEVAEVELSMSFNAKGEFLGFGVGGAASIKVKIKPVRHA